MFCAFEFARACVLSLTPCDCGQELQAGAAVGRPGGSGGGDEDASHDGAGEGEGGKELRVRRAPGM